MLRFYEEIKVAQEIYPWRSKLLAVISITVSNSAPAIFGKLPYPTLSKIYRELRCQHHLIQEHNADQPVIPALTPDGFQEWMTAMIQAYPDIEYERLSKAVLVMPISNSDDRKERFPKEFSRRLFPLHENLQAQQRCAAALSAEGVGPLRKAPTFPPPPPISRGSGSFTGFERERSPYAAHPDSTAVDSDEENKSVTIPMPIERERKPYSAAPGGGKVYENEHSRSLPPEHFVHEQRRRAQSTASQSQWGPPSNTTQLLHARTDPQANSWRPQSPGFSGYGTRSDPNVGRDVPGSYHSSSDYDMEDDNRRFTKDADSRRNERSSRHADSDSGHRHGSITGTDASFDSQRRSKYDEDAHQGRGASNAYDGSDRRGYDSRRY